MNTEEKLIELIKRFEYPIMFGDIEIMRWSLESPELLTALTDYLIANGVTIPVRCKDCKHYEDGFCDNDQWWNDDFFTDVNKEDFCSYGERIANESKNESTGNPQSCKRSGCRKRQL